MPTTPEAQKRKKGKLSNTMNSSTNTPQTHQENGHLAASYSRRSTLERPPSRSHRLSQGYDMQAGYPEQLSGYEIVEDIQRNQQKDGEQDKKL
ncbi:hypothetical protein CLU79DRAFT_888866 [Phycomyces nitens]|nr:hypothetical protein CLU79DRAFT_888866 [Phycomyces nitens]